MPPVPPAAGAARRRSLVALLALVVLAGGSAAAPAPLAAATPTTVEAALLEWTNRDRAELGLRPLRRDARLAEVAEERAANLRASSSFSHQAAGPGLAATLDRAGVQWYAWAENIAWWGGGSTRTTAAAIYGAWRGSPGHWAALMSSTLNYVGFGAVHRAADNRLFAAAVFTESRDRTPPGAKVTSAARDGTTVTFTWRGWDPALQSHWAGLRDFDVWYRVDGGTWRRIRDDTTRTSISLADRAPGHRYWLRVQARDRAGNAGRPSSAVSVWVP